MTKAEELRKALQDALDVFDAHEMEVDELGAASLSCDNDGEKYCNCFEDAMNKILKIYLG